jgi:integrase
VRPERGVFRRGSTWYISWNDRWGRRHREAVGPSRSQATKARQQRLADSRAARFRLGPRKPLTLAEFLEKHWDEIKPSYKPATVAAYESLLKHHLSPHFGEYPLPAITRAEARKFITAKARQQRWSWSRRNPNPRRPALSVKTIRNMMALLSSILSVAAEDYSEETGLDSNPIAGILKLRKFPLDVQPDDTRPRFLEPTDFVRAVGEIKKGYVRDMVLVAALAGPRWAELTALRPEDVDLQRNRIRITQSLYQRLRQIPKTQWSVGDVDLCPTVRRILERLLRERKHGFLFSPDDKRPLDDGPTIKREWRRAQLQAGIKQPISWHDLRHEFASLLIAAGKHVKFIAKQLRHKSAGFSLDRYGHLFEDLPITTVEWWDDLLPWHQIGTKPDGNGRDQMDEQVIAEVAKR